jgi:hypothetical protein
MLSQERRIQLNRQPGLPGRQSLQPDPAGADTGMAGKSFLSSTLTVCSSRELSHLVCRKKLVYDHIKVVHAAAQAGYGDVYPLDGGYCHVE